ncbi:MAG: hypothetical protein PUC12_05995 [Clostridiales bacterium]|nr:hypothetical protein [Clostridiales bacterium]
MNERLENRCRQLIENHEYIKCEKEIREAMAQNPHSAVPHNLMGILLEMEQDHVLAMKHFRAAYALNPTYVPARFNMEQYGKKLDCEKCAYTEEDCQIPDDPQFEIVYDEHHVGHLVRK